MGPFYCLCVPPDSPIIWVYDKKSTLYPWGGASWPSLLYPNYLWRVTALFGRPYLTHEISPGHNRLHIFLIAKYSRASVCLQIDLNLIINSLTKKESSVVGHRAYEFQMKIHPLLKIGILPTFHTLRFEEIFSDKSQFFWSQFLERGKIKNCFILGNT